MAEVLQVLGQIVPSPNTLTSLYTVPALLSASISSVIVCNQNSTTVLFRISIAVGGAGDDPKQYLYYDLPLDGNDTFIATVGLSLATTDVVKVQCNTGGVSFNIFGVEV